MYGGARLRWCSWSTGTWPYSKTRPHWIHPHRFCLRYLQRQQTCRCCRFPSRYPREPRFRTPAKSRRLRPVRWNPADLQQPASGEVREAIDRLTQAAWLAQKHRNYSLYHCAFNHDSRSLDAMIAEGIVRDASKPVLLCTVDANKDVVSFDWVEKNQAIAP